MPADKQVLILGGTGEAFALAKLLASEDDYRVINSLAGRTRAPLEPPGELHLGGFGGAGGLADYLRGEAIDAVIDATHPFAAQMSRNAQQACSARQVPYLQLQRPPWEQEPGDLWISVASLDAAAEAIVSGGFRRVFLTTGRQELKPFAALADCWFLLRSVDPLEDELPLQNCRAIVGRGPFDEAAEAGLMREQRIDAVVTKNSGGPATYGKILAARQLGLPVIVIQRPPAPDCNRVARPEDAVRWLKQLV